MKDKKSFFWCAFNRTVDSPKVSHVVILSIWLFTWLIIWLILLVQCSSPFDTAGVWHIDVDIRRMDASVVTKWLVLLKEIWIVFVLGLWVGLRLRIGFGWDIFSRVFAHFVLILEIGWMQDYFVDDLLFVRVVFEKIVLSLILGWSHTHFLYYFFLFFIENLPYFKHKNHWYQRQKPQKTR